MNCQYAPVEMFRITLTHGKNNFTKVSKTLYLYADLKIILLNH